MAKYIEAKTKHLIHFEQAVILLDQVIEYLRFNFRGQLYEEPTRMQDDNTIRNIAGLRDDCLLQMARGQPGST